MPQGSTRDIELCSYEISPVILHVFLPIIIIVGVIIVLGNRQLWQPSNELSFIFSVSKCQISVLNVL